MYIQIIHNQLELDILCELCQRSYIFEYKVNRLAHFKGKHYLRKISANYSPMLQIVK